MKISWVFLLLFPFFACNVTKHLDETRGEKLVVKNKINFVDKHNLSNRPELLYSFGSLYKQAVNKHPLGFRSRVWAYYKYKDKNTKFARWAMKKRADPPTIFSDELTQRTAKNFENYLKQRGYFNAKCTYEVKFLKKKAKVKYDIVAGERYSIDSIQFISRDTAILEILNATRENSLLSRGDALDGTVFDAEKQRITGELKNRGYAYFIANFIEFTGDSSGQKAKVTLEVLPFSDTSFHKKYRIGKVAVFTSLVPDYNAVRRDTTLDGIYFASAEPKFWVDPVILKTAILFRPGYVYRQSDFDDSYKKLSAMGVFRFVTIKPTANAANPQELDVTVTMAPLKRLGFGWDADFNYSNNEASTVSNNLLGAAANVNLRNRNLLRGAENLQTSLGYNITFDPTNFGRFFNSQEIKLQNELTIPRFADYFGLWRGLKKLPFGISDGFYNRLKNDAEAHFSLNFNYLDLIDYYTYKIAHTSYGYKVAASPERSWTFNHIGIDILLPTTREKWPELAKNEFIRRSFGNQLFTGFLMRSFNYNYFGKSNRFGEQWNFRFGSELSGAEQLLAHTIWSKISGKNTPWLVANLEFSKFAKLEMSGSYTRAFRPGLSGAFRLGAGVATAFGDTKSTPYVKQLYIGGPNSLRAWRVRELGPGGYFDEKNANANPPFYQTGDFLFEFTSEIRFDLFWWFKGAVFLDGGNIWVLKKEDVDTGRPGAELRWDSYKNIALGSGVGLRADFGYFLFRLDLGLKLRRPFETVEKPGFWLWGKWKEYGYEKYDAFNLNIAVGYPF